MSDLLNPTPEQVVERNTLWAEKLKTSVKCKNALAKGEGRCCLGVAQDLAVELGLNASNAKDQHNANTEANSSDISSVAVSKFFGWGSQIPHLDTPKYGARIATILNDGDENEHSILRDGLTHKQISECVMNTFVNPNKPIWTFTFK